MADASSTAESPKIQLPFSKTPIYSKIYRANYRAANLEKCKAAQAKKYLKNKDKIKARSAKYRAENREKVKAYRKKHREQNVDKIRAEHATYYSNNVERVRIKGIKYRAANPEVGSKARHLRRARKRNATVGDVSAIAAWEKKWRKARSVTCYWCCGKFRGSECHPDHVTPLSRGGLHDLSNLVIACKKCNLKKGAKPVAAWNKELRRPLLFT